MHRIDVGKDVNLTDVKYIVYNHNSYTLSLQDIH